MSLTLGEHGIFTTARGAGKNYLMAQNREILDLVDLNDEIETIVGGSGLQSDVGKEAFIFEIAHGSGSFGFNVKALHLDDEDCEYDIAIDWGDGTQEQYNSNTNNQSVISHSYEPGNYTISITGKMKYFDIADRDVTKIKQWGTLNAENIKISSEGLTQICEPTENSFINLQHISFQQCSNLTSIPDKLFDKCPNVTSFSGGFSRCTSLTSIPDKLFYKCQEVEDFERCFSGCSNLTSIPDKLFAKCPNVTSFSGCFSGCSSLTSIPEKLFDKCQKVEDFGGCFSECTSLTGNAPELWKRVTDGDDFGYEGTPNGYTCFCQCTNLTNFQEIPYYWKAEPGRYV